MQKCIASTAERDQAEGFETFLNAIRYPIGNLKKSLEVEKVTNFFKKDNKN